MTDKVYYSGQWWYDYAWGSWCWSSPGFYNPAVVREKNIILTREQVHSLITELDKAGWIVPRLDERLRNEDLKIISKLMGIIEKGIMK